MKEQQQQQQPRSIMEKHIQTILVSLVTLLVGWVGFSVNDQGKQIVLLTERVSALQIQIQNNPGVTKDDVLLLLAPQRENILDMQGRLSTNTRRIERLEKDLYIQYPNPSKRKAE